MGHCQRFFMWYFYSIVNTCTSKWTRNGKLKLKLVRPEKKNKGPMTRRRARMPTLHQGRLHVEVRNALKVDNGLRASRPNPERSSYQILKWTRETSQRLSNIISIAHTSSFLPCPTRDVEKYFWRRRRKSSKIYKWPISWLSCPIWVIHFLKGNLMRNWNMLLVLVQ